MSVTQTHADLSVAGRGTADGYMKAVAKAAVHVVNEHYTPSWEDNSVVSKAVVKGQCKHEYSVLITFEGRLSEGMMDDHQTEFGRVAFKGFLGDGTLDVGVTPRTDTQYSEDILTTLDTGEWMDEHTLFTELEDGRVRWVAGMKRHLHLLLNHDLVEQDGLTPYVYRLTDAGAQHRDELTT